jgi:cyanophycin synthetase
MRIMESIVFRGPNHWSARSTIELRLDLGGRKENDVQKLSALIHRLQTISGLKLEMLSHFIEGDHASLPVEFEEEALTRECITAALRLLDESSWRDVDLTTFEERRLVDLADDIRLGPSSRAILDAAIAKNIPFYRLNRGSLVQLGEGVHQRRIWTAETDATSAIAEAIASDKQLTRSILESIGVNVPLGSLVANAEEAWEVALQIGLPVVVKPCNANHARGVSLELNDRDAVLAAYDWAKTAGETDQIMVEQFIVGDHHRLLVVGGRMVAASRGQREYVVGDGSHSISELVAEVNRDPRRGLNYTDPLGVIPLNDAAAIVLGKQGFDFQSVPSHGTRVLVKHVGDLIEDCTDMVHPTTAETAVLAATAVGLDVAGLDLVASDISKPLSVQRGGIVEVNAGPSLSPHVAPLRGQPRPVGQAIIEMLFPDNKTSTIPILIAISSTEEWSYTGEMFQRLIRDKKRLARISRNCISVDGKSLPSTSSFHRDVRGILGHPFLEGLVIELSIDDLLRRGFPCAHAEGVVLDLRTKQAGKPIAADHSQRTRRVFQAIRNLLTLHGQVFVIDGDSTVKMEGLDILQTLGDRVTWVDQEKAIEESLKKIF